jgi:hypothetical protein
MELDDIDDLLLDLIEENKGVLKREGLRPVHPEINCWYNSFNVFIGKQGSGKTFSAIREIARIALASKQTRQLIYITKKGDQSDATVQAIRKAIAMPIVYVAEDDAEHFVQKLDEWMCAYKEIKDGSRDPEDMSDEEIEEMCEVLRIDSLKLPFLHMIILFDDFGNSKLVKKPESYFCNYIATLRHKGVSVYACIQERKGLSTAMKSHATTIFLFPGYSPNDLRWIFYQTPCCSEIKKHLEVYENLGPHQKLIINTVKQTITLGL